MKTENPGIQLHSAALTCKLQSLDELDSQSLFDLLKLRVDVFVVEQQCIYPELDRYDKRVDTLHVRGFDSADVLVACARLILPDGSRRNTGTDEHSNHRDNNQGEPIRIGRVAVSAEHRGKGYAREMMHLLMQYTKEEWPEHSLELAAQSHLTAFYTGLGFEVNSGEYIEDGIPHVDMRYSVSG